MPATGNCPSLLTYLAHCPLHTEIGQRQKGDNGWIGIDARLSSAPGSNGISSNEIAVAAIYLALALLGIAVGGWYIVGRVVLIGRTGPSIMTSNGTLRPPPPPVPKVCSLTA